MGMAVEYRVHRISIERLFESARTKKGIDLRRLADHRSAYRRVMEQRNPLFGAQLCQRGFELEGFLDGLLNKILDRILTPGLQRLFAKAAAEPLGSDKADAENFNGIAMRIVTPASAKTRWTSSCWPDSYS